MSVCLSPCYFFLFPVSEWRNNWKVPCYLTEPKNEDACRTFTRAVEDLPKSTWAEKTVILVHAVSWLSSNAEGKLFEKSCCCCCCFVCYCFCFDVCLVSPVSKVYPKTFGASLVRINGRTLTLLIGADHSFVLFIATVLISWGSRSKGNCKKVGNTENLEVVRS